MYVGLLFVYNSFLHNLDAKLYFLDPEDHTWELKGSFEHILSGEDEEIEYEVIDKQPVLHILKVGCF